VDIVDDTEVCPLCGNVLTKEEDRGVEAYPDIGEKAKMQKRLIAIFIYVLIVSECVCCLIDYYMDYRFGWSLVTGVCIFYAVFTVAYSFNRKNNHIWKIFGQSFAAFLLLLLLDVFTGADGWSVTYGLPCAVLILDVVLVACMLVNFSNWHNYLLLQLFALIVSFLLLILYFTGITASPALPWTAFGISALIFSFCFFIGYREAKSELKKRFHI